jgi:hypothetical protein
MGNVMMVILRLGCSSTAAAGGVVRTLVQPNGWVAPAAKLRRL